MRRRLLQIVLLVTMVAGAAAPTLACISMEMDGHACCRIAPRLPQKARLAAKSQMPPSQPLPSCCRATTLPSSPQPAPVERDASGKAATLTPSAGQLAVFFRSGQPPPPQPPLSSAGDLPPPFLLHCALLI